jgi:F420-non-reducing hydrogenase large subunit
MKIEINPVSRIEGHAKVTIFLDSSGKVENAFFQATEFRGYEKILSGLPMEEVPRVVSTICGICRAIHFTAALKAADQVFGVEASDAAKIVREMLLCAHFIEDHTLSLLALALPDFLSPEERNIFGVIRNLGELGRELLRKRGYAVRILQILGGRNIHPVTALPGGWAKAPTDEELGLIERYSRELLDLGYRMVEVLEAALDMGDGLELRAATLGTEKKGLVNLYDGEQVVKDEDGREVIRFSGKEYADIITEKSLSWSYSKLTEIKPLGEKLYVVGPLARLKTAELTPKASEIVKTYGFSNNLLYNHFARAVEIIYAAERLLELSQSYRGGRIQNEPQKVAGEGVGIVEAPRGTLIHHYWTDEKGIVRGSNLIVATTHNVRAINHVVGKVAERASDTRNLAEKVEVAIRAFDPCMACATHAVNGVIPIEIQIFRDGELEEVYRNYEESCCGSGQSTHS